MSTLLFLAEIAAFLTVVRWTFRAARPGAEREGAKGLLGMTDVEGVPPPRRSAARWRGAPPRAQGAEPSPSVRRADPRSRSRPSGSAPSWR